MPTTPGEEAELVRMHVDQNPAGHRDSTPEEVRILADLYGEPDEYGIFRSAPGEEGDE